MNATDEYSDIISKINDAKEAASKEHAKLTKRREELVTELTNIDSKIIRLRDIVPSGFELDESKIPSDEDSVAETIIKGLQAAANKNIRNQKLIDVAIEIGEKNRHSRFFVSEVAVEAVKRSVEMGIPENRYNTVISRILSRNKNFELKKSGCFKLIKKDGS